MPKKKSVFDSKRYWYHVSTTLNRRRQKLIPWDESKGFNRGGDEPAGNRICVAPTLEQCITAVPYALATIFTIYRTERKVKPVKAKKVYDSEITDEGWLLEPTVMVRVGKLDLSNIEHRLNIENVIESAASEGDVQASRRVYKWWKKINVKKFVKRY